MNSKIKDNVASRDFYKQQVQNLSKSIFAIERSLEKIEKVVDDIFCKYHNKELFLEKEFTEDALIIVAITTGAPCAFIECTIDESNNVGVGEVFIKGEDFNKFLEEASDKIDFPIVVKNGKD